MSQLCLATFAGALQKVLIQPAPSYRPPSGPRAKKPSKARPKMASTDGHDVEVLLRWIQDLASIEAEADFSIWRSRNTVNGPTVQKLELHTGFGPVLPDPELLIPGASSLFNLSSQPVWKLLGNQKLLKQRLVRICEIFVHFNLQTQQLRKCHQSCPSTHLSILDCRISEIVEVVPSKELKE